MDFTKNLPVKEYWVYTARGSKVFVKAEGITADPNSPCGLRFLNPIGILYINYKEIFMIQEAH